MRQARTHDPQRAERAELRRAGRRRLWRALGILALLAVLGGLVAAAYFSPLMSVREVQVTGTAGVPQQEVLTVAEVPMGKPLLQVDTAAIARRVSRIPAVEAVRVDRSYPSALHIAVTERTPRALIKQADGRLGVMDRLGVVYVAYASRAAMGKTAIGGVALGDLPVLDVSDPGPRDPTTLAALEMIGGLPGWLRPQVESVSASSPADLTLHLTKGRTVIWGDAERGADKADALSHILPMAGNTYNVSAPDYPAVS
ncbi:cell division protein FtsQ/DivIB [Gordonia sp. (in: high G+C Gram-positive bacteria)]|uniref:cell division protein FtsQ/DivIB n=1 Tax=Gordonia sp. (in: high G+C Gram-positive bacteria) TaxID=84139 RepID=UPI003527C1F9